MIIIYKKIKMLKIMIKNEKIYWVNGIMNVGLLKNVRY